MANLQTNHMASNLLTRGNMNISAITKGFILPSFEFEIVTPTRRIRGGGSAAFYEEVEQLHKKKEEIDHINIFVNWNKSSYKMGKKVTVELIQKKLNVELLTRFDSTYNINVKLIDED